MKQIIIILVALALITGCKKERVIEVPCDTSMLRKVVEEVQPDGFYLYTGLIDKPAGTGSFRILSAKKMTNCDIANDLK